MPLSVEMSVSSASLEVRVCFLATAIAVPAFAAFAVALWRLGAGGAASTTAGGGAATGGATATLVLGCFALGAAAFGAMFVRGWRES